VPEEVRSAIEFVFVDSADDVLTATLGLGAESTRERTTQPILEPPPASVH
jgi:hypothetical protein